MQVSHVAKGPACLPSSQELSSHDFGSSTSSVTSEAFVTDRFPKATSCANRPTLLAQHMHFVSVHAFAKLRQRFLICKILVESSYCLMQWLECSYQLELADLQISKSKFQAQFLSTVAIGTNLAWDARLEFTTHKAMSWNRYPDSHEWALRVDSEDPSWDDKPCVRGTRQAA